MASVSPTPLGQGSHFTSLGRRTSARQALRRPSSRPYLARSESNPVPSVAADPQVSGPASQPQQFAPLNDSSDDEIPVPMKLSALTKALLSDGGAASADAAGQAVPTITTRRRSVLSRSGPPTAGAGRDDEAGANLRQPRRHVRANSNQVSSRESSPAPRKRVIRLSTTPAGGTLQAPIRRSMSASRHGKRQGSRGAVDERDQSQPSAAPAEEVNIPVVNTPATNVRRVQIALSSSGSRHRLSGSVLASKPSTSVHPASDYEGADEPATAARSRGSASRATTSAKGKEPEPVPQSSMRVKRVGKLPGSFLSGPARRGRRRPSEDDGSSPPDDDKYDGDGPMSNKERDQQDQYDGPTASPGFAPYVPDPVTSGSPVGGRESAKAGSERASRSDLRPVGLRYEGGGSVKAAPTSPSRAPLELPSADDQENARSHMLKASLGGSGLGMKPSTAPAADVAASSPDRKVLGVLSKNTPHRPAPPPPPRMTVLETATAPAGAATTAQAGKKQRILLKVNGRPYQRVDCIGRGGSSKVYKVTAENGRMLALKRVSLENADDTTVKGYQGEIDLLLKLSGVDRIIQLFDWELNQEKQMLSLLMEMGELDLNSLLRIRQTPEGSKLDPVFVRFYWKEMLECLQAVHTHDIVHSDLKPANFVLVQGRLKLIDFGIANAIQTDETVNVHRETQIGTPNYMSPESLMDSQQYALTAANNGRFNLPHGPKGPRLMKLGKPSDVWSLGCILYQMVYGQPPFGHIQNQLARCHAIINWGHSVDFPDKGMGGVPVPPSLLWTIKRCLNREQQLRPTCEQLLSDMDPFLYPQEFVPGVENALPVTEELLGRIIQSVVTRCRDRMPTDGEAMTAWPSAYWASVRKAVGAKDARTS